MASASCRRGGQHVAAQERPRQGAAQQGGRAPPQRGQLAGRRHDPLEQGGRLTAEGDVGRVGRGVTQGQDGPALAVVGAALVEPGRPGARRAEVAEPGRARRHRRRAGSPGLAGPRGRRPPSPGPARAAGRPAGPGPCRRCSSRAADRACGRRRAASCRPGRRADPGAAGPAGRAAPGQAWTCCPTGTASLPPATGRGDAGEQLAVGLPDHRPGHRPAAGVGATGHPLAPFVVLQEPRQGVGQAGGEPGSTRIPWPSARSSTAWAYGVETMGLPAPMA